MAGGIVYLDIDDEITSAAARIRNVSGRRVALVIPYGSRVATSRINFRLLSRDSMINDKQLAVVAGDSATRALAASAGLPVFGSVAEYESSLAAGDEGRVVTPPAGAPPIATPIATSTATAAPMPTPDPHDDLGVEPAGIEPLWISPARGISTSTSIGDTSARVTPGDSARAPAVPVVEVDRSSPSRPAPRSRSGLPVMILLVVLGLVVLVGSVGAYLLLPSATIVVTPRPEGLPPVAITVTADPTVTSPDVGALVVPADIISVEVTTSDTFPATGRRIEETAANGTVRFENLDFLRSNLVPAGSIVSTNAGARFRTTGAVTVPRADLVGLTVFPGRINVSVTAVEPGTAGNVEPNTIVIVPKGEDPKALKVVNKEPTTGGTHEEFPLVAQEDVDGAIGQLSTALSQAFESRLADPSIAPPGATILAETADLGAPTPSVDPTTLIGQEIESFTLGLTAAGTVIATDPTLVAQMADEFIRASVEPGHELVAGSIEVEVGKPNVSGGSIEFSATATGRQIAILDTGILRDLVLGKSLDDARELLAPFGAVELSAWPDWVVSVPTVADRVTVRIETSVPVETAPPTGSRS